MTLTGALRENLPCYLVNNLTRNGEEQCKFIIDNDCLEDESTIDYVYLVFCEFDYDNKWAAIILVLSLVVILFLNLSAVADEFLCPNLLTVAKNLRMSDNLAGVTLLAFGNGCPDIFSSLAAASSGRPEIIVGELLGAGIFCSSIVAGLIFIHSDFKLARRPLLRDASFYLLAVFLIWLFCYQGRVTFYGSSAFIIIYVIYLFFALSGQAIHSRLRGEYPIAEEIERQNEKTDAFGTKLTQQAELEYWFRWREESLRRGSLVKWSECCKNEKNTLVLSDNKTTIRISYQNPGDKPDRRCVGLNDKLVPCGMVEKCCWTTETSKSSSQKPEDFKCPASRHSLPPIARANVIMEDYDDDCRRSLTWDEFYEFLTQISPIYLEDWTEANLIGKTIFVLRAPLLLITTLTVPVVNKEKKDCNWNRLLNSIQCITIPIGVIILLGLGSQSENYDDLDALDNDDLRGRNGSAMATPASSERQLQSTIFGSSMANDMASVIPFKYLLAFPGIGLALFVFYSTSARKVPKLHAIYSYFGFAMSIMWIYVLANEIISILKTVGIIFSMTDTAIGLGVLAWGNSLGDIVANLTLAEAGYARMALGASIGAPLLNLLLGFGLAFCVSLKPGEFVEIEYTHTIALLAITLALVLVLLMLSTLASGNRSKKPFGYLLISCYGAYLALAVCFECDLLGL